MVIDVQYTFDGYCRTAVLPVYISVLTLMIGLIVIIINFLNFFLFSNILSSFYICYISDRCCIITVTVVTVLWQWLVVLVMALSSGHGGDGVELMFAAKVFVLLQK